MLRGAEKEGASLEPGLNLKDGKRGRIWAKGFAFTFRAGDRGRGRLCRLAAGIREPLKKEGGKEQ